jgi:DNA-binding GntR family transcriptional regulator
VRSARLPNPPAATASSAIGDDLDDLYSLRLLVEATGIRLTVPTVGGPQARTLCDLAEQMDRCSRHIDPRSLALADRAFHLALVAGGGPRIRSLAEDLAHHTEALDRTHLAHPEARRAALREHRSILACALEQDADGCAQAIADHHLRTVSEIAAELGPGHGLERVRIAAAQVTNPRISALHAA